MRGKRHAPSDGAWRWYGQAPEKWPEVHVRCEAVLANPGAQAIEHRLAERARHGTLTLLHAARAGEISDATVLAWRLGEPTAAAR